MAFKIMCYNIERGFHSTDHNLEKERLLAAQRIVKQENPDILALTEACYGQENSLGIKLDYQDIFDFPYGLFGGYPNFGPRYADIGGNCLLSRFPMQGEAIKLAYKGAVRAAINIEDKILNLDVVHPSYSVSDQEKISTLSPLITSRKEPYIVTGDFNTIHPEDKYDWDIIKEELKDFNAEKAALLIDNWQKAGLVSWLLKLGLKDSFTLPQRQSTVPTKRAYQEERSGVRMDFFFISPEIESIESYVLKNEDTEIASDHYPIVGIFKIK